MSVNKAFWHKGSSVPTHEHLTAKCRADAAGEHWRQGSPGGSISRQHPACADCGQQRAHLQGHEGSRALQTAATAAWHLTYHFADRRAGFQQPAGRSQKGVWQVAHFSQLGLGKVLVPGNQAERCMLCEILAWALVDLQQPLSIMQERSLSRRVAWPLLRKKSRLPFCHLSRCA